MVFKVLICLLFFTITSAFCDCKSGIRFPYNGTFDCDFIEEVKSIQDRVSVKDIRIYNSTIVNCDFNLFSGMVNLERIFIGAGLLKRVTERCFQDNSNLMNVTINHQNLPTIDLRYINGDLLNHLALNSAGLNAINLKEIVLTKLGVLSLDGNNLRKISIDSFYAPQLETIFAAQNKIDYFDIEGGKLLKVDLSNNLIKTTQYSRLVAPKLSRLKLSGNPLTIITSRMLRNFPRLQRASFLRNPTEIVDLSSFNIRAIKMFKQYIEMTRGRRKFSTIVDLAWIKVSTINLSKNRITDLRFFKMRSKVDVKVLSLALNDISSINKDNLKLLPELLSIDLTSNQLTWIDPNAFEHNLKLKTIILRDNFLQSISETFFESLHSIEIVDLAENHLEYIPLPQWNELADPRTQKALKTAKQIYLEYNPFTCRTLDDIYNWMMDMDSFIFAIDRRC